MESIKLNDILQIDNLSNVKIRFNLMFDDNWNPIEIFKNRDFGTLLRGHYYNKKKHKSIRITNRSI